MLAALVAFGGCSSYPAMVGPRPPKNAKVGEKVQGSACGVLILGFIPASVNSRTERAYEEALGGGGGGLTDTKIQYSWYVIPMVGYLHCTTIEGTVVR